ncbi:hypothetical protein AURDEDRAFT_175253 [Auricularia subglabra TFB-10046 SS5]|nr:hypothetical protein AURDEDRAFT_175253 [Auricularia subglabra TFB-10046 SS5]
MAEATSNISSKTRPSKPSKTGVTMGINGKGVPKRGSGLSIRLVDWVVPRVAEYIDIHEAKGSEAAERFKSKTLSVFDDDDELSDPNSACHDGHFALLIANTNDTLSDEERTKEQKSVLRKKVTQFWRNLWNNRDRPNGSIMLFRKSKEGEKDGSQSTQTDGIASLERARTAVQLWAMDNGDIVERGLSNELATQYNDGDDEEKERNRMKHWHMVSKRLFDETPEDVRKKYEQKADAEKDARSASALSPEAISQKRTRWEDDVSKNMEAIRTGKLGVCAATILVAYYDESTGAIETFQNEELEDQSELGEQHTPETPQHYDDEHDGEPAGMKTKDGDAGTRRSHGTEEMSDRESEAEIIRSPVRRKRQVIEDSDDEGQGLLGKEVAPVAQQPTGEHQSIGLNEIEEATHEQVKYAQLAVPIESNGIAGPKGGPTDTAEATPGKLEVQESTDNRRKSTRMKDQNAAQLGITDGGRGSVDKGRKRKANAEDDPPEPAAKKQRGGKRTSDVQVAQPTRTNQCNGITLDTPLDARPYGTDYDKQELMLTIRVHGSKLASPKRLRVARSAAGEREEAQGSRKRRRSGEEHDSGEREEAQGSHKRRKTAA